LHTASTGREAPGTTVGPRGGLFQRPPRCAGQTEGLRCEPPHPSANRRASANRRGRRTTHSRAPARRVARRRRTRAPAPAPSPEHAHATSVCDCSRPPEHCFLAHPGRAFDDNEAASTVASLAERGCDLASSPSRSRRAEPVGRAELLMPVPGWVARTCHRGYSATQSQGGHHGAKRYRRRRYCRPTTAGSVRSRTGSEAGHG
jgi:hypothetical protein